MFDTLIALWISFPHPSAWRRSFAFRWKTGGHKLAFDLHRSGAMCVTGVLIWARKRRARTVSAPAGPPRPIETDARATPA